MRCCKLAIRTTCQMHRVLGARRGLIFRHLLLWLLFRRARLGGFGEDSWLGLAFGLIAPIKCLQHLTGFCVTHHVIG